MADIGDIGGGFRLDARKWGRCVDASRLNQGVVRRGNDDVMIMTDVEGILKESMP